jgi:hypothetical protein
MKITGKELHNWIEKQVPGFQDDELFTSQETYVLLEDIAKDQLKHGFVSVDNTQGMEAYYCGNIFEGGKE